MIQSIMNFKMVRSMKKWKSCVKFLVCIFAMSGLTACSSSDSTVNTDTPNTNTPIIISTASELQAINNNLSRNYTLIANIDLSADDFTPLGNDGNSFDGTFDGGGFTINNLTIDLPASNNIGLFGNSSGIIKDLTLENVDITGNVNVAGLVGSNNGGIIENVSVENVDITGNSYVGGFIGFDNNGTYRGDSSCQQNISLPAIGNNENITGITTYDVQCKFILISTGSKLQAINDNLSESYRLVKNVDLSGDDFIPLGNYNNTFDGTFDGGGFTINNLTIDLPASNDIGLFGVNSGTIRNVTLNNTDITGKDDIGGLVGINYGIISNNSASGSVDGDDNIGGLVGYNETGTISNSSASGSADGDRRVGGLVGINNGTIEKSSSSGSVTGSASVAGFVGENSGTIEDSSSSGSVLGFDFPFLIGGFVGYNNGGSYINDEWCKPVGSSLTDTGAGDIDGVVDLDANSDPKCQ